MSGDETTWYELLPDGHAEDGAERYAEKGGGRAGGDRDARSGGPIWCASTSPSAARRSAAEHRRPDLGERSRRRRARAEVDGLHLLPRGEPEC